MFVFELAITDFGSESNDVRRLASPHRCTSLVRVNLYKGGVSCPASLPALPSYKRLVTTLTPLAAKVGRM
jgi:hypothetical protein